MKMIKRIALFVMSVLFSCGPDLPLEERLQHLLDEGIDRHQIHGVSAAVIFPNDSLWTGVSGVSHDTVAIDPEMVFAIGSITKNVMAALTLKLAEEGLLSLDHPLSRYLPEYDHIDKWITIRQLLNHTSGIYSYTENEVLWQKMGADKGRYWTPEEVLALIKAPYFAAGEGWHYSNTNYLLLALIIKKVSGSGLSALMDKYFWTPLDIHPVYLSIEDTIPDHQVHIYGDDMMFGKKEADVTFVPRTAHESIIYGSGGLFMSAANLARWSQALFGGAVLEKTTLDEMLNLADVYDIGVLNEYGLGTQGYNPDFTCGEKAIGHGGANIGTSTYMVFFPDYRLSVVVMINAFPSGAIEDITGGLMAELIPAMKSKE